MRPRLIILIAAGCLLAASLLLWLQVPNHFSNYLTRWVVQDYREQTGASSVPISIDMRSPLWPGVIGIGLFLAGVALLTVGVGMCTRRYWWPVMSRLGVKQAVGLAIVPVLAIVALWRPVAVQYHKVAMRSWHSQEDWEAWSRHQQALIALGYFEPRDFPLERRTLTNNSDLMRLVDPTLFRDGQWAVTPRSNRVSVTAYRGDMALWEEIVARFDRAEPSGAANRSQPIRAETNRTSVAAGSDR